MIDTLSETRNATFPAAASRQVDRENDLMEVATRERNMDQPKFGKWWHEPLAALILFSVVLPLLLLSPNSTSSDSRTVVYEAMSLLREGNLNLDEYVAVNLFRSPNGLIGVLAVPVYGSHRYSYFPYGTALMTAPMLRVLLWIKGETLEGMHQSMLVDRPLRTERVLASVIVSLTAVLVMLFAAKAVGVALGCLAGFTFALASPACSTASMALWQHGPTVFMISLVLLLLLRAPPRWSIWLVGLPLGMSYIIRPTSAVFILMILIYLTIRRKAWVLASLAGMALVLIPFILYNYHIYGQPLPPYYNPGRLGGNLRFWEAFTGNLLSPGRGLFIFYPVFFFSLYGMYFKIRDQTWNWLDACLLATLALHLFAISSFQHWWGGHSLGPRFMTDMIPIYIYFMLPALNNLQPVTSRRLLAGGLFMLTLLFSIVVNYRLTFLYEPRAWSVKPTNIDQDPGRMWDWSDISYLRR